MMSFLFCFNSFTYSIFLKDQNNKPYQAQIRFTPDRKKRAFFSRAVSFYLVWPRNQKALALGSAPSPALPA